MEEQKNLHLRLQNCDAPGRRTLIKHKPVELIALYFLYSKHFGTGFSVGMSLAITAKLLMQNVNYEVDFMQKNCQFHRLIVTFSLTDIWL